MEEPGGCVKQPFVFRRWQPGPLDALRSFLLSDNLQSATQLTAGVLFVSLFVFVDTLRFPGSCVAILLYFVVAVTAAPDCHVGTRIFLCGFMVGPMWLSLLLGGVIATLGKLAPTQEAQLIVLCVLGPLALVPFAANRMSTSHLYMFAMGLVSCLYLGMPILAGWPAPDITTLWARAVGYVLVAALLGMFAGSVLSMIVMPSLASHKLEEEVSTALRLMGQYLSHSASLLWRPGETSAQALPQHLQGLHPLLLPSSATVLAGEVAPGILDSDIGAGPVSPRQVYVAVMDWFEHLSRPPSDPAAARSKSACLTGCRSASTSDTGRSSRGASTFYGPTASSMAAAVAAAASDTEEDQQWQQHLQEHADVHFQRAHTHSWTGATADATAGSSTLGPPAARQLSTPARPTHLMPRGSIPEDPLQLRLGSTVTAASVKAAKTEVLQVQWSVPEQAHGAQSADVSRTRQGGSGVPQPCASISEVRQLLAHAQQLLDAAGAEPQWLRHGERPFQVAHWTKVVAAAQLVALRLKALDLLQRDFVSFAEKVHSFPVAEELSALLQQLYGSAAAALALLAEQVRCREQLSSVCAANQQVLKHPQWRASRERLLQLLEGTLVAFFERIQQASTDDPVTVPSSHWVRRWMFFHTTTLSLMDALDGLAAAAEAALPSKQQQTRHWWQCWRSKQQQQKQQQQLHGQAQPLEQEPNLQQADTCGDVEAGLGSSQQPEKQQLQVHSSNGCSSLELASQPGPPVLSSLTSMRLPSSQPGSAPGPAAASAPAPVPATAAAAADIDGRAAAAVPPTAQLPPAQRPAATAAGATAGVGGAASAAAAAAAAAQQPAPGGTKQGLQGSFMSHTAWIRPWLPLALNVKQYENLRLLLVQEVPRALSSRQALLAALRNRRVQAAFKYWCVLVLMLVGTLLLMYFVPVSAMLSPTFGYTLAAVGMSDRVESTVFKVALWTGATFVGATLGWALMAHPSIALNSVALAAVMCAVAFFVGTLDRGPSNSSSSSLLSLFTLTTLASIVLCQCCGRVGSTLVSLTRGASVLVAALIVLLVQNLILPWYTSTWALEQLGLVYKEATEVLADLVCQLYEDTEALLQQQHQAAGGSQGGQPGTASGAGDGGTAAGATAAGDGSRVLSPLQRLRLLDEAVRKVWISEQQQLQEKEQANQQHSTGLDKQGPHQQQGHQQQQAQLRKQASFTTSVAATRLASIGRLFTGSSQLEDLLQPSRTAAANNTSRWLGSLRPAKSTTGGASGAGGNDSSGGGGGPAAAAAAVESALGDDGAHQAEAAVCEMVQLLQQRRLKSQGQQGVRRVAVTGLQLQARLVRPLVLVKISLVLDTTAWRSGPLATPPLVLSLLRALLDLVDALAALQQAVSMPVQQLSGSWDWTLMHAAGSWAATLMQAMQLADATATHVLAPSAQTAHELLTQIQEVQHKRFEHYAVQKELRRLLYTALATDKEAATTFLEGSEGWQLQGQLRYSACVYATGKVLDQITAAARCALQQKGYK